MIIRKTGIEGAIKYLESKGKLSSEDKKKALKDIERNIRGYRLHIMRINDN
jgi:hypothetical protein